MKTTCYHTQSDLKVTSEHVQLLTETVLEFKNVLTDEVIVHFVDEETISELHDQYFNDPSSTDCITFPIDGLDPAPEGEHILGEIFICPQVAQSYAKENLTDPYQELSLYLVHGLLHLIGYDDQEEADEKVMREEEKKCMKVLQEKNALFYMNNV